MSGDGSQRALIDAAAQGDRNALRQLLDALAPHVASTVRAIRGPRSSDLDDLTQEALLGVIKALPSFRHECHITWFAGRIATRTAVAAARKSRKQQERRETLSRVEVAEPVVTPEQKSQRLQRQQLLRELLADLPEEQAEALAMRVVLGCSLKEISDATEAPVNTVRSRMRLAKEALRRRIESSPALHDSLERVG